MKLRTLCNRAGKLVGAACAAATIDTLKTLYRLGNGHSFDKGGDRLAIAKATAQKFHISNAAINDVVINVCRTDSICFITHNIYYYIFMFKGKLFFCFSPYGHNRNRVTKTYQYKHQSNNSNPKPFGRWIKELGHVKGCSVACVIVAFCSRWTVFTRRCFTIVTYFTVFTVILFKAISTRPTVDAIVTTTDVGQACNNWHGNHCRCLWLAYAL